VADEERSPFRESVTVPAFFGWPKISRPAAIAASDSRSNIGENDPSTPLASCRTGMFTASSP
jgi:hypothetical protein